MIISLMNNKGGVLKTTLATNLASILASKNKNVLIIDADPQSNVNIQFNINNKCPYALWDCLVSDVDINKAINKNIRKNIDYISSSKQLVYMPMYVTSKKYSTNKAINLLKNKIKEIKNNYDYIIIDSAPSLDILSINVASVSNLVLIPGQMELNSGKGIVNMQEFISDNAPNAKIMVVPTLYDNRTTIHKEILKQVLELAKNKQFKVSKTKITRSVQASNTVMYEGEPIVLSKYKGKQKDQYTELTKEIEWNYVYNYNNILNLIERYK